MGPTWVLSAPYWSHEPCYQGMLVLFYSTQIIKKSCSFWELWSCGYDYECLNVLELWQTLSLLINSTWHASRRTNATWCRHEPFSQLQYGFQMKVAWTLVERQCSKEHCNTQIQFYWSETKCWNYYRDLMRYRNTSRVNSLAPGRFDWNFSKIVSKLILVMVSLLKLPSQHRVKVWLGAVRQQALPEPMLTQIYVAIWCLCHNELKITIMLRLLSCWKAIARTMWDAYCETYVHFCWMYIAS